MTFGLLLVTFELLWLLWADPLKSLRSHFFGGVPNLVVSNLVYAEALFWLFSALLRSFADLRLRSHLHSFCVHMLGGCFGPEKKKLGPPPQIPQFAADTLPAPPPRGTPPLSSSSLLFRGRPVTVGSEVLMHARLCRCTCLCLLAPAREEPWLFFSVSRSKC